MSIARREVMAEAAAIRPLGALRRYPTPSAKGTIGDLGHTADFHPEAQEQTPRFRVVRCST